MTFSRFTNTEMIMVVDDNVFCAKLLEAVLVRQGFNTRSFTNPRTALNWYAKHHQEVGLVFLDIHMPQLSGPECLEHILSIDADVKVAFVSSESDPKVWQKLSAKGDAVAFFTKPINYRRVADWSQEMLSSENAQMASP